MQERFENSIFRSKRDFKLADQIRKDLATILHQKIRDPRLINVTITDVEISRDLRVAKIFYSVYPWSDKILNEVETEMKIKETKKRRCNGDGTMKNEKGGARKRARKTKHGKWDERDGKGTKKKC